jgi:tRNA (guanine37-N1)-methyltransferase
VSTPVLRVDVLTMFPTLVEPWLDASLIGRARRAGLLDLRASDLRVAAEDPHRSLDDSPFGGGAGMVLAPEPVFAAVERLDPPRPLYLLGPAGRRFDQAFAAELAGSGGFSLLCARYEGVDERIREHLVDGEISLGDFVLAGGEVAALAVIEATCRLVPGVLGNAASAEEESFADGLLEYPHYTRPAVFRGWEVPEVLRCGDHARVARWRRAQAIARTVALRPDLVAARGGLSPEDRRLLDELRAAGSAAPADPLS